MEDSFNIWDTVYIIDEWFIEQWILSGIYEDEDWVVFDIEFDCWCIKTFSPIVVFLDQVELMDYYNTQFLNILDDMEDEDEEKPTGWEKTTKLKK